MKNKIFGSLVAIAGVGLIYGAVISQYCLPEFGRGCGNSPEPGNIFGIFLGVAIAIYGAFRFKGDKINRRNYWFSVVIVFLILIFALQGGEAYLG